ncbi:MAG TPA: hypothetical protein DCW90_04920 [Lachnospiraceae bacterium]|nr:hypothetical protein [Lachnospiraceae bacterium]
MHSGSKYTSNIDSLYGRARDILDPNKKWNNGNGVFSNLLIQIDIMRPEALGIGCKLTGRHGNKSVVSKILPDDQMPRTKDGRVVELLVNNLAIINRTIGGPIFEESQNFCSAMAVKHMKNDLKTLKERGNFLFEFISMFNERQGRMMKKTYDELTTSEKKEYIEGVMDGHIYLNMMPVGEDRPFFYKLLDVYKKYDWIKPEEIYIHRFGRDILTLQRQYIGEMYIVALKQTSKKGFSVRGMGAVNNKGLPERSYKNKSHMERYSTSDIRFGEFESLNFLVGMSPDELALFHAYYRSAPDARKELGKEVLNPKGHVKLKKKYISRVGSIFSVIMKSLGYSMQVVDDEDVLKEIDDRHLKVHTESDGVTYLCTDYQDFLYERIDAVKNEILGSDLILDNEELKQKIDDRMVHSGYIVSTSQYKKLIGVFAENGDLFKGLQELSKEEINEMSESSKDAV